jgi:histidinol phosphatase-like PHP family hydrolase
LDYGQIAFRILYSFEGVQPEMEDIYVLPGWENSREGMKKLMNAMFNDPYNESSAVKKYFNDRKSLKREELTHHVKQAITKYHSTIMNHVGGKSTFKVFYEESNHLMRVLLELVDKNIPALPVHDCLYVRLRDKDLVKDLMETSFKEYFKVDIKVK